MRDVRWFLVAAVVATCMSPVAARAQGGGGGGGGAGMRERMEQQAFQGITLSERQRTQVDSIHGVYRPQLDALGPPGPDNRSQRREIMQKQTADVRAVLTPDQQTQFDKNIAEMRSRMRDRGGPQ